MFRRVMYIGICAALALMTTGQAFAGAGANVNACIYLPVAPAQPLKVDFTAGGSGDHCMNDKGKNASLSASTAGVSCTSVGYVESKSSSSGGDTCASDDSIWTLGYTTPGTGYSGSTQSNWSHPFLGHNHIALQNSSKDTYVCTQASLCNATKQQWDAGTQGPLYIIFEPGANN